MITDIKHTVLSAMSWPAFDYAAFSAALAGPFNEDYNQWNQLYQCHGNPNGKVYTNVDWFQMCFDVDNQMIYVKFGTPFLLPFPHSRMSNTDWQVQIP